MQVTCESCGARYKLDSSRFSGSGARITCPRCQHVFVVYREGGAEAESTDEPVTTEVAASPPQSSYSVDELDFRKVGIQAWKVKVKIGLVYDFSDYRTLAKYITDGRVTTADKISHDGKEWIEIGTIDDLEQHFIDVYVAAEEAQKQASTPAVDGVGEFDGDEPTDIFGLKQAEAAKAEVAKAKASKSPPKKARSSSPKGGPGPGVDDELMKMAQNLSQDIASGDPSAAAGASRFVDPFEQMRRKKRKKAKDAAAGVQLDAPSAPVEDDSGGGSKVLLAVLFLVAVGAGVYLWMELGQDPGSETAVGAQGKNQGQVASASASKSSSSSEDDDRDLDGDGSELGQEDGSSGSDIDPYGVAGTDEGAQDFRPICEKYPERCQGGAVVESPGSAGADSSGSSEAQELLTQAKKQASRDRAAALRTAEKARQADPKILEIQIFWAQLALFEDSDYGACHFSQQKDKAIAALEELAPYDDQRMRVGAPADVNASYLLGHYYTNCKQDVAKADAYLTVAKQGRLVGWIQGDRDLLAE